jgi:hypothetical protein
MDMSLLPAVDEAPFLVVVCNSFIPANSMGFNGASMMQQQQLLLLIPLVLTTAIILPLPLVLYE